ncbi:DNA-binding NarL/FixJ family response regulator [Nonomuraea thailandensis]|uniref:DNA-binding NarL/FixJ family response regulator n=1 Tax=Nonomuraea thailandensis TaxID=1188745 RepID=A0A9X2GKY7_9ACTN|nr:DNA-binding NarL/FixJ family response regulator [Nonomuraea thailandensis]
MIRVVVVDDQAVVREGLVLLLGLLPGIEVVGSAGDGEAALRVVDAERPDVVLMDLRMPRMDGVEATGRIRAAYPDTQVVVLTTYSDDESVFAALRAGARGFLTKDADADDIASAVATVMRGDAQLDPTVQRRLLDTMAPPPLPGTSDTPSTSLTSPPPPAAGPRHDEPAGREATAAGSGTAKAGGNTPTSVAARDQTAAPHSKDRTTRWSSGQTTEAHAQDREPRRSGQAAATHAQDREPRRSGQAATAHAQDGETRRGGQAATPHTPVSETGRHDRPPTELHQPPDGHGRSPDGLTPRETEVLRLIAEGLSNAEIATRLYITEATVKTHINNLFAKAHLRDRAQAVTYAYRHGLAHPG